MREFEKICGVEHVDKRLFHGLRRAMEKLVGEHTTDEAVRDIAGGWSVGSGTRETVYTDPENEERLALAAQARAAAIESIAAPVSPASRVEELAIAARRLLALVKQIEQEEQLGEVLKTAKRSTENLVSELTNAALEAEANTNAAIGETT